MTEYNTQNETEQNTEAEQGDLNYTEQEAVNINSDKTDARKTETEKSMDLSLNEKASEEDINIPRLKISKQEENLDKTTAEGETLNDNSDDSEKEQDFSSDDSIIDPNYQPESEPRSTNRNFLIISPNPAADIPIKSSPLKIGGKKRKKGVSKDIAKIKRNLGQEYISPKTKKVMPPKEIGSTCTEKCKWKCASVISNAKRKELFDQYWALGDLTRQREFIARNSKVLKPSYRFTKKDQPRNFNSSFFFVIDCKEVRVCKLFFVNTLGISDRTVRTVKRKLDDSGFLEGEKRGKHDNHQTLERQRKEAVREFISKIPRTESHYLRAQTSREYIDGSRSLSQIFRDYETGEKEKGAIPVSEASFKRIFYTDFNISQFTPKKDQCALCESVKNDTLDNDELKENYDEHLYQKELSRISKEIDKMEAHENVSNVVCTFDLQSVLPCPIGNTSNFYYKSKMNCYNFTITNIVTQGTTCFFWHEGGGKRGANEIASCLFKYLCLLSQKRESQDNIKVTFYSDNCTGQNKNKFTIAMFLYAVQKLPNIITINHKFLICGHTQNEGDSAHSLIEKAVKRYAKKSPIYTPATYTDIIKKAKPNKPFFELIEMTQTDFVDFKKLQTQLGSNFDTTTTGEKLQTSKYKICTYETNIPLCFNVQTTYDCEIPHKIDVAFTKKTRKNSKDIQKENKITNILENVQLTPAYERKIEIPANKKTDIMDLINANQIPKSHALYYKGLFSE